MVQGQKVVVTKEDVVCTFKPYCYSKNANTQCWIDGNLAQAALSSSFLLLIIFRPDGRYLLLTLYFLTLNRLLIGPGSISSINMITIKICGWLWTQHTLLFQVMSPKGLTLQTLLWKGGGRTMFFMASWNW